MNIYKENRPWGSFEKFTHNIQSTVKILTIEPNTELSLQYHFNREEFWKVLSGEPTIQIDETKTKAKAGDQFFIPKKIKHKIFGGKEIVQILEISLGEFDEKDEVRLEDKYNRTNPK
jgi:mannose-6-phosphate isomerase-like protein (cupin superfamily)